MYQHIAYERSALSKLSTKKTRRQPTVCREFIFPRQGQVEIYFSCRSSSGVNTLSLYQFRLPCTQTGSVPARRNVSGKGPTLLSTLPLLPSLNIDGLRYVADDSGPLGG